MGTETNQVVAVVEGHHLYVGRKNAGVELLNFSFNPGQHLAGVFVFSHHHDSFHHVVVVVQATWPTAGQVRFGHFGHVFDQHRIAIQIFNDQCFQCPE